MDQVLEFVLEAPEREFLRYLEDCGDDPAALAREGREAVARALGSIPAGRTRIAQRDWGIDHER